VVKSPGQVTLTCYAACPDITLTVTPDLKAPGHGTLILIDLGAGKNRLGGSALSTVYNQIGDECADLEDPLVLKRCFETVQALLDKRVILSGHDRSDGGLLVTVLEMAFAGNCGVALDLPSHLVNSNTGEVGLLFGEELGLVLEVDTSTADDVLQAFAAAEVPAVVIGKVSSEMSVAAKVTVTIHSPTGSSKVVLSEDMNRLRDVWESTSYALENLQCEPVLVEEERRNLLQGRGIAYHINFVTPPPIVTPLYDTARFTRSSKVAVIRQEGSNGDREMLSAVFSAGLEAWDVNMRDIASGGVTLDQFRGIVFCGGFSYADVLGSAKGWAAVIRYNDILAKQFERFRERKDSFSLGVCNGCQLMALLGWVPYNNTSESEQREERYQPRFIHNRSGRFESRWCAVKVLPSPAVLLEGMTGAVLGVWVAHGEGRLHCPREGQLQEITSANLAPLRFVKEDLPEPTVEYPFNPNGSPDGVAALCSADGRHLAMMPHPERCYLSWQWPYLPREEKKRWQSNGSGYAAPWLKLFHNARLFCEENA